LQKYFRETAVGVRDHKEARPNTTQSTRRRNKGVNVSRRNRSKLTAEIATLQEQLRQKREGGLDETSKAYRMLQGMLDQKEQELFNVYLEIRTSISNATEQQQKSGHSVKLRSTKTKWHREPTRDELKLTGSQYSVSQLLGHGENLSAEEKLANSRSEWKRWQGSTNPVRSAAIGRGIDRPITALNTPIITSLREEVRDK
jgi:hypothetical protein